MVTDAPDSATSRQMGRHDQALADFTRAIELDPKLDWAIAGRGQTYRQMGRHGDALADYGRLVELDAEDPEPHFGRALVALVQGHTEEGHAHLERAVLLGTELAENEPVVDLYVALCLFVLGRSAEARERLRPELVRRIASDDVEGVTNGIAEVRDVLGPIDGLDELLALLANRPG